MLKTFEPRILPSASWFRPFRAATRLVASSGRDVPPARMVTAMNLSLTPSIRARAVAESTKRFPPKISPASPVRTRRMACQSLRGFDSAESSSEDFPLRKDANRYKANTRRKMTPSKRERPSASPIPSREWHIPKPRKSIVTSKVSGMSRFLLSAVMDTGQSRAVSPRMNRTLKMFEPRTLPTATSAFPSKAPVRLTTSSGHEVPKPTMVRPITNSLTPAFLASVDAPSTSQSAPRTISPRPTSSQIIVILVV